MHLNWLFICERLAIGTWQFSITRWNPSRSSTCSCWIFRRLFDSYTRLVAAHFHLTHDCVLLNVDAVNSRREMESIKITPGFCPNCGSILPHMRPSGKVKCYNCLTDWPPEGECPKKRIQRFVSWQFSCDLTDLYFVFSIRRNENRIHDSI